MSTYHMDIFVPGTVAANASLQVQVIDFGADGVYGGNDDTTGAYTIPASSLKSQAWSSLDIPLKSFTGLSSKSHLGQIVFTGSNLPSFYADNIYLYNNGSIIPKVPTAAAPIPTAAASAVLSIFSDTYTNVAGTDFNPNWGQSTATTQVSIAGNNTLNYAGLNYQGTQFASNLNVSGYKYIHIDYYTTNSTALNFYLISPGPAEKAYALPVPSGLAPSTNGWKSVDIPLSAFTGVDLSNVIQFKVDGNGDVYFDNWYFHN